MFDLVHFICYYRSMNQSEKKKQAILAVTFRLLSEKEVKNITVDEISEQAEVSKVTLFKYFQSKNHLMNLVIMRAFEHMAEDVREIIDSDLNFEETYESITQMKLRQVQRYTPIFQKNLMTQYSESPDFFDTDTINVQMSVYTELFDKGQREGKISPELTQADFLFILNIFIEGMKGLEAETLYEKTPLITRFFLNGFS
ncbi:TetR/AcrR family transcriptional regulator [Lactovum odontotermitis]